FTASAAAQDAALPVDPMMMDDPAAQKALGIEKELRDVGGETDEDVEFCKKLPRYTAAMNRGELDEESKKLIAEGIAWRIRRLSLKRFRNELPDRRRDVLVRDLTTAGQGLSTAQKTAFRKFVLDRIVEE